MDAMMWKCGIFRFYGNYILSLLNMDNYYKKYIKYKLKYLNFKNLQGGAKFRPSPAVSATLFDIDTTKLGNDKNEWIVVENTRGVKRWKLHKKNEEKTIDEIDLEDLDATGPVKMDHPDYDFDNYLEVSFKRQGDSTEISVEENPIHSEYKLAYLLIFVNDDYEIRINRWGHQVVDLKDKGKYKSLREKEKINEKSYSFIIEQNLLGANITMNAMVTPVNRDSGLLDVEINKEINNFEYI
jgi:hypothetical protein